MRRLASRSAMLRGDGPSEKSIQAEQKAAIEAISR